MDIDFIAFDSLGVKSSCTSIKTKHLTLVIDPGVAVESGSFPLSHKNRTRLVNQYKQKIRNACKKADALAITHYHYDHHIPDPQLYKNKTLLLKDWKKHINKSQKNRATELLVEKQVQDKAESINIADNQAFQFEDTSIQFSKPLWHGPPNTPLGYVISCTISDKKEKLYYTSDLNGLYLRKYADMIIKENPDILILDGPPTYILGYILSYKNLAKSILNIKHIVENINANIVLDHHLLRDYRYKDLLNVVYETAYKHNVEIKTAAEYMNKVPKVLEAYDQNGPTKWKNWTYFDQEELKKTIENNRKTTKPKPEKIELVNKDISACKRCDLHKNRKKPVPGEGPSNARIMFIGEAPGKEEDQTGRPFVGRAGQVLDKLLACADIKRKDVFITSVIKCRPPSNRNPRKDEIKQCNTHLRKQMLLINPKVISPLGNTALKTLLDKQGIGQLRGREIKKGKFLYFPMYHPAAAIYNNNLLPVMKRDMKKLKQLLQ